MKKSGQLLFSFAKDAHEAIYVQLGIVQKEINQCGNVQELADYCYAIDRAHELIEDAKKQLWKLRENCNALCCKLFISSGQGAKDNNIKTDYVTATPDVKISVGIPSQKTNPEGYAALMRWLQIPAEILEKDVARPHWPGLITYISDRLAAGEAIPEDCGVDLKKFTPIYKLTLRKRREVLDQQDMVKTETPF